MTRGVLLGLVLGMGFVLSVSIVVYGTVPGPRVERGALRRWLRWPVEASGRQWLAAGVTAVLVGAVTGWPVAALLALASTLTLPRLLGRDRKAAERNATLEAVAVWAEMLRDTLSAAAGLEQAIMATAPVVPPALREKTTCLAARIDDGQPLGEALRAFADDVDDATGDMVTTALVMAAEHEARHLASLLGQLAGATREQVMMRLKIEAGRARVRTSVRVITATTLGMALGLVLLNRTYLDPYSTAQGQMVLALVGGLFALAFWWLAQIATLEEEPRILKAGSATFEKAVAS